MAWSSRRYILSFAQTVSLSLVSPALWVVLTETSGDRVEEPFCEQRIHKTNQWRHKRRVRSLIGISVQRLLALSFPFLVNSDIDNLLIPPILQLVAQNHDAQVRFKWNENDLAIWDNRSNWHCATYDYDAARAGDRVCSLGEAPYLDIGSKSRRTALAGLIAGKM